MLMIQRDGARAEGKVAAASIARIKRKEKAVKAIGLADLAIGVATGTAGVKTAAKAVAKKASTLIVKKASKFGKRTTASKTKQARKTLDANKKAATPKKKPQRKNASEYDDPNYLPDREMTRPYGKPSRARVTQFKKQAKKADRKKRAALKVKKK
jgi:hypothetical protein